MTNMTLSGTDLARGYYTDVVAPLLDSRWPGLPHAAGRLGSGSDVLGLDDEMSRDHDFGLRLTLLVAADVVEPVRAHLADHLPPEYRGHPTRFATTWDPLPAPQVDVSTAEHFVFSRLGVEAGDLAIADWLSLTGQAVLEVTAGEVFADSAGALRRLRDTLAWYPDDLWRYVLAADWARIGQELPFVGRTAVRGDDTGSRLIAARIANAIMRLGFLLERRWPPYPKWLGTRFSALPRAGAAAPALDRALTADSWQEREGFLAEALTMMHELQRDVGLPTADPAVSPFYDRPFLGLGTVSQELLASVTDERVRALPSGVGAIEQWSDNVDVLTSPTRRRAAVAAVLASG
ncbi:DUF4037 domain-containing protein [Mycetocola sp. 2940]|uniref:DUF4037 domain-containing protein n=1 Tax=Mycetocola sp. 2940 TaxID=3156452 RepID=UPI003392F076